jgi:hypothetical protein
MTPRQPSQGRLEVLAEQIRQAWVVFDVACVERLPGEKRVPREPARFE